MKMMDSIPVWGEHEEKTLAQIRTCAATLGPLAFFFRSHFTESDGANDAHQSPHP